MPHMFGTLFFNGNFTGQQYGFSETYPIVATDYASATQSLKTIYGNRIKMLTSEITFVGSRMSDGDIRGDSYPTGIPTGQPGTYTATGVTAADPALALMKLFSSMNQHRGPRWIRAIPMDNFTTHMQYIASGVFVPLLSAYASSIIATCAIAKRIGKFPVTPAWTFNPIDTQYAEQLRKRNYGRPFELPVGRRMT